MLRRTACYGDRTGLNTEGGSMKLIRTCGGKLIGLCVMLILAWPALAADLSVSVDRIIPESASISPNSVALANEILDRWEPIVVKAGQHSAAWRELFATQLGAMDASVLDTVNRLKVRAPNDAKASYAQFTQAVRGAEMQSYLLARSGKGHMKLASTSTDQVFIPIVPCRIVDTRKVGGPISAGQTRNFYFYTDAFAYSWGNQGGPSGFGGLTCPGTWNPNGGAPSAAVITVTVVSPTAAGNWILWGGANPIPNVSALNWAAGQTLANTTVVVAGGRSGTGGGGTIEDFAVAYNGPSGSAHLVVDVVGYLAENKATELDCSETAVVSAAMPAVSSASVSSNACPAGWGLAEGNCDSSSGAIFFSGEGLQSGQWTCHFFSYVGGTISASSICCRVPGLL
jgi:hypothetical protein